jgi:hypothetical protein
MKSKPDRRLAKHNPMSVTSVSCKCGSLERMAEQPDSPIVFDTKTNEFQFKYRTEHGNAELLIYHCPFCGGAAPKSIRDSLFAAVSTTETLRLNGLLADIETLDDALKQLGPPDQDFPHGEGAGKPEKDGNPPSMEFYRVFLYGGLSKTVDVYLTDYHRDRAGVRFQGKYLGSEKGSASPQRTTARLGRGTSGAAARQSRPGRNRRSG